MSSVIEEEKRRRVLISNSQNDIQTNDNLRTLPERDQRYNIAHSFTRERSDFNNQNPIYPSLKAYRKSEEDYDDIHPINEQFPNQIPNSISLPINSQSFERGKNTFKPPNAIPQSNFQLNRNFSDSNFDNINLNTNTNINNNINNLSHLSFELQKAKEDQSVLKSDNIMYKEDIYQLTELNRHFESELQNQRQRNYDLASENDKLNKENLSLHIQADRVNTTINQIKVKEKNAMENLNNRLFYEKKLLDNEVELNQLKEESQRKDNEYAILQSKYKELYDKNNADENEVNLLRQVQSNKITDIENRLTAIMQEISDLRSENSQLRKNNETSKNEVSLVEKDKDSFKQQYQEQAALNKVLNEKLNSIQQEFEFYKNELMLQEEKRLKEEALRLSKLQSKNQLVSDLQKRIANYRSERLKKKNDLIK